MNTREIATEYRLAQWTQMIQERVASGETIKDFCQRRGISRQAYFYWQRKLRLAAANQIEQASSGEQQALVPSGWTQINTTGETKKAGGSSLPIEIGRCRIMADEDTDTELLKKVCQVLMSLC